MSSRRPGGLIGIARYRLAAGHGFEQHSHATHQLSWARNGLQRVEGDGRRWVLPASEALWTPGGSVHDLTAVHTCDVVLLYFAASVPAPGWEHPVAVGASAALRALVERLPGGLGDEERFDTPLDIQPGDLVESVDRAAVRAPMPIEEPARQIAEYLVAHPDSDRTLVEWGREVGASSRTLARSFARSTGMTFSEWRIQTRLDASLALLADGVAVTRVARHVGYASASSFIVAFHRQFGHSPTSHFAS